MSTIIQDVRDGDIDAVKKFLSSGSNVDEVNDFGNTALMKACVYGRLEIAKLLVENGANITHQNNYKNTPLIAAVCSNKFELAKFILEHVDEDHVNHETCGGDTALRWAAKRGNVELAKLLLEKGADPYLINNFKRNAIEEATHYGNANTANFIRSFHLNFHVNKMGAEIRKDLNEVKSKTMRDIMNIKRNVQKLMELFQTHSQQLEEMNEHIVEQQPQQERKLIVKLLNQHLKEIEKKHDESMKQLGENLQEHIHNKQIDLLDLFKMHSQQLEELNKRMVEHQPKQERQQLNQPLHDHSQEDLHNGKSIENNLKRSLEFMLEHYNKHPSPKKEKSIFHGLLLTDEDKLNCPIHSAVQYGFKEDIEAAVEKNQADQLKVLDSQGRTAMDLAALTGQLDVVEFLQCRGGVFHKKDPATMMAIARIRAADVDAYLDFARSPLKEYV